MKYEMVESFFDNLSEYMRFFLMQNEAKRATSDFSCVATLKKEDDKYLYSLEWQDGKWLGEYVRPFRVNKEYLRLFHAGCAEVARRLRIFLDTGDLEQVPMTPPAFGILSCESPDNFVPPPEEITRSSPDQMCFPGVEAAKPLRRYDVGMYTIVLMTDVKCQGIIHYTHLLVALKKGDKELSCVVAAEENNFNYCGDGSGSHFLCCYSSTVHKNLGCSDNWGDLSLFEKEACKVMGVELNIQIEFLGHLI